MNQGKKYSQETLNRAIELIQSGQMTILGASKAFGIPYGTLGDKVRGRRPIEAKPKTVLSMEEEKKIVDWILEVSKRGFSRSKEDIKDLVKSILDARKADTVFQDNRPGKDWMAAFLSRHKEISERVPQALGRKKATVSADSLTRWFEDYKSFIENVDPSLLNAPDRLYNADESGFSVCPTTKKVLASSDAKQVYQRTNRTRTRVTALTCYSASGECLPPLLIFPCQRGPRFNPLEGFENAFFQRTKDGWISSDVFFTWLKDVFIPHVDSKLKPVVLFVDGYTSHVNSIEICKLCRENNVLLYCLQSHFSHLMQPLDQDQTYFGVLKRAWSEAVRKYILETGEVVTLRSFSKVFFQAWQQAARSEIAFSWFSRSGLFPFNPSIVVSDDKLKVSSSFALSPNQTTLEIPKKQTLTSATSCPDIPYFSSAKLDIMEDILEMGVEEGLKNIRRLREGYNVPNENYTKWTDLFRKLLSTSPDTIHKPAASVSSSTPISQASSMSPSALKINSQHTTNSEVLKIPSFLKKDPPSEGKKRKKEEQETAKNDRKKERVEEKKKRQWRH